MREGESASKVCTGPRPVYCPGGHTPLSVDIVFGPPASTDGTPVDVLLQYFGLASNSTPGDSIFVPHICLCVEHQIGAGKLLTVAGL